MDLDWTGINWTRTGLNSSNEGMNGRLERNTKTPK